MTLPLTTTTITVADGDTPEPYEGQTWTTRHADAPAHISSPSGAERVGEAGGERIDAVLLCEVDVWRGDRVTDAATDDVYRVAWVQARTGLGLDHTKAGLVRATGAVPS